MGHSTREVTRSDQIDRWKKPRLGTSGPKLCRTWLRVYNVPPPLDIYFPRGCALFVFLGASSIDAPSPERRANGYEEDDIDRTVLIA